jgi:translation initiation factor 3 subunit F
VEAVVLFNICDSYVRRPDQAERVIGTLLGSVLPDGTIHVRNSYVVPHSESADQVLLPPHATRIRLCRDLDSA